MAHENGPSETNFFKSTPDKEGTLQSQINFYGDNSKQTSNLQREGNSVFETKSQVVDWDNR